MASSEAAIPSLSTRNDAQTDGFAGQCDVASSGILVSVSIERREPLETPLLGTLLTLRQ